MRMNESNQNHFDSLLKAGLKRHTVGVPADFAQKLLTRIQRQEYAAALAAVKKSEHLLVAVMVLVPVIAAIIAMLVGPHIMAQLNTVIAGVRQTLLSYTAAFVLPFKFWVGMAVAGAILIYVILDSVLAEN
jgi:hypothetical protein